MDFVNRLRGEHLKAFWYFPSKVSFALIGIRLSEYRWTLGVSSRLAHFLTFAIQSLDNFENLLANLPEKPRTAEITPVVGPERDIMDIGSSQEENMFDYDDQQSALIDSQLTLTYGHSGLMSPSTSTESGSTYDALADTLPDIQGGIQSLR